MIPMWVMFAAALSNKLTTLMFMYYRQKRINSQSHNGNKNTD